MAYHDLFLPKDPSTCKHDFRRYHVTDDHGKVLEQLQICKICNHADRKYRDQVTRQSQLEGI